MPPINPPAIIHPVRTAPPPQRPGRTDPAKVSITHNFRSDHGAQGDVGQPRKPAPHDGVLGGGSVSAGEVAAEPGDFGQIVRERFSSIVGRGLLRPQLAGLLDGDAQSFGIRRVAKSRADRDRDRRASTDS